MQEQADPSTEHVAVPWSLGVKERVKGKGQGMDTPQRNCINMDVCHLLSGTGPRAGSTIQPQWVAPVARWCTLVSSIHKRFNTFDTAKVDTHRKSSYKRVKGRSHTVEKQRSHKSQLQKSEREKPHSGKTKSQSPTKTPCNQPPKDILSASERSSPVFSCLFLSLRPRVNLH